MIEPKSFYTKLDGALNRIFKEDASINYLPIILSSLEETFGKAIGIANGRIYEAQNESYILVHPEPAEAPLYSEQLPTSSEAILHVLRYGTYIYDNPDLNIGSLANSGKEYSIPAAFSIEGKEENWIFVFDLRSGWQREEVEFCFNSVRDALNHRLYADGIKDDLKQAASIQRSLLPKEPPVIPGFDIAFRSRAAELIVGDLYDFHIFDEESFGVCIGDACGHGFPAALLVRDIVTGLRMGLEKELKTVHSIKKLNRVIHQSNYSTRYVSLFYCEIQNEGDIIYVNAGHPPPLLTRNGGVEELEATGITIGFMREIKLHQMYRQMNPGDFLVLYSDGVTERMSAGGQPFGTDRLKDLVVKNKGKSAGELIEEIFTAVYSFGGERRWRDDTTALVIKRLKEEGDQLTSAS